MREPGHYKLTVRFSDGATWTKKVDLPACAKPHQTVTADRAAAKSKSP